MARVSEHGAETLHLDDADELLGMLTDDDPFGVESFATHHLPLNEAPSAYEHFQKKEEGMVQVVFRP